MEDYVRRIIEDNRKARKASSDRFTRLTDVLHNATPQEFSEVANEILGDTVEDLSDGDESNAESGNANTTTTTTPEPIAQPASPSVRR